MAPVGHASRSCSVIGVHVALLIGLTQPGLAAGVPPAPLSLNLAPAAAVWRPVVEGGGAVTWSGAAADAAVTLKPGGGYAGIAAPLGEQPISGLIDAELTVVAEGTVELCVGFSAAGAEAPPGAVWLVKLPGGKAQRLGARLAPPALSAPLHLHLGARGAGSVRLSGLTLVSENAPPLVDAGPLKAPLPPNWQPEGTLDARSRRIGQSTELSVEVNGIGFSVIPVASGALGGSAIVKGLVTVRGQATKSLAITGQFPDGVVVEPRDSPVDTAATDQVSLRCECLLPGVYNGKLILTSGRDSAALPLQVTVGRNYPAFGTMVSDGNRTAGRWQLREMRVKASPTSTADELIRQVAPLLDEAPAMPAVYFDGLPTPDVLRAFMTAVKGKVALYSPAYRPDRPFRGPDPRAEAEALLALAKTVLSAVRSADLDAHVLSPVFDASANQPGSPEAKLLEACLAAGLDKCMGGVIVTAPALPPGGVLGELANGKNVREPSAFWAGVDRLCDPSGIQATLASRGVALPILTSGITGPASTDEQVDALKVARTTTAATYGGATGVTFREAAAGDISLLRADGALSAAGIAVKELSRELAGAAPIARSWKGLTGVLGEPIVILPFVRESEGILVLWNNTSVARSITLTMGAIPYSQSTVTISGDGTFVSRTFDPHFRFVKEALQVKRQDVYLKVAPLQVMVVRFRLEIWTPNWLASVTFTPQPQAPASPGVPDDRPWWQKLQDWAEGHE